MKPIYLMLIISLVLFGCRDKRKVTNHIVSDDSATLYIDGAPNGRVNGDWGDGTKTFTNALCIKEARALPNSVVYCDSLTNTIYIGTLDRIIHVYDSLNPMQWHLRLPTREDSITIIMSEAHGTLYYSN